MSPLIVANWKEYGTIEETKQWVAAIAKEKSILSNVDIVVCPPFTLLPVMSQFIKGHDLPIAVGAQNVSRFAKGSYTGEVSALMVQQFASYVILGHSERRTNLAETDEIVAEKVSRAQEVNITVIFCASKVDQVRYLQNHVPDFNGVILLEDPNAISTGQPDNLTNESRPLNPDDANALASEFKKLSPNNNIIYGGSIDVGNVTAFLAQPHFKGVVIGARSLNPSFFLPIVKKISEYAH